MFQWAVLDGEKLQCSFGPTVVVLTALPRERMREAQREQEGEREGKHVH